MTPEEKQLEYWMSLSINALEAEISARYPLIDGDAGGPKTRLSQIREKWRSISDRTLDEIDEKVCKGLNYCENSKDGLTKTLIYTFAGCITVDFGAISVPVLLIAILLLKMGVLDKLCECKQTAS